jgi:predicted nuclease of predicted toxin-antitoxin system
MKLLLDENLSPTIAVILQAEGIDICHVRERGLLAALDPEVLDRAFAEDRILITVNVGDFVKLARAREVHAGIVAVESAGLLRDEQLELVRRVIETLRSQSDMVNRVLRVAADMTMTFEDVPPAPK